MICCVVWVVYDALPTELTEVNPPYRTRTCDPRLKRQTNNCCDNTRNPSNVSWVVVFHLATHIYSGGSLSPFHLYIKQGNIGESDAKMLGKEIGDKKNK